jgi:hypothetical protein
VISAYPGCTKDNLDVWVGSQFLFEKPDVFEQLVAGRVDQHRPETRIEIDALGMDHPVENKQRRNLLPLPNV